MTDISKLSDDRLTDDLKPSELVGEIIRLRKAIRDHYQKTNGHSMCWENDVELWRAIDEGLNYPHMTMPGKAEMLSQCERYIESRLNGLPYVEPEAKTCSVTRDGKRLE